MFMLNAVLHSKWKELDFWLYRRITRKAIKLQYIPEAHQKEYGKEKGGFISQGHKHWKINFSLQEISSHQHAPLQNI